MIKVVSGSLFDGLPPYSVIMHQTNCLGIAGAGVALQMKERFPDWYDEYSRFCTFFAENDKQPDRSYELMGSFHKYAANEKMVICSAFAQHGISKVKQQTDYGAWEKILRRIETQIHRTNSKKNAVWTLHIPYGIGCGLGGGDWSKMMALFEYFFKDSPVELVIHKL